ncbi:TetR/AcrR family transcriptional regulator [Amycolatopsis sp. FDAARGOS 1241]|uniref:TetR/AcrR family transcriptional regulator n=1 Tax=Amycolatopsis sp. FDAARGOS 1241 TaxID=2778070 RepID=UPI001951E72A|nr:TetR/AcrR family transcriptional regulator [Amycolatopsis sp. FDAARGOS 1241]QRP48592.1 TetR/AcrR family transcriptional regulator [Amycolatopsis sp. FDAARGOS 1241]
MAGARRRAGDRPRAANSAGEADRPGLGGRPRDTALDEAIVRATRERLVRDGYSDMTIGDIAADAKVTRRTLYLRWSTKFDLVVDALDYGFRKQGEVHTVDLSGLEPREALVEAVRRVDPAYHSPDAMVLMGDFAGEANRTPELLEILRKHAVQPRVGLLEKVLTQLQQRRAVSDGIDVRTIATMCFGTYFAPFYRGEVAKDIPDDVVAVLWPAIVARTTTMRRRSTTRPGAAGSDGHGAK